MLLILGHLAKFLIFTRATEQMSRSGAGYRFKFSRATGASWALYHELQGIWGQGARAQAFVRDCADLYEAVFFSWVRCRRRILQILIWRIL